MTRSRSSLTLTLTLTFALTLTSRRNQALLHDTPVRPPLLAATANPSTGPNARKSATPRHPAATAAATAASPSGGDSGGDGGGNGNVGGSTQRETSAERWAEAHRPSTPHTTATWTSGGACTTWYIYRAEYITQYINVWM